MYRERGSEPRGATIQYVRTKGGPKIGRRDYDITEIDITESDVAEFDITENDITESDITETNIT